MGRVLSLPVRRPWLTVLGWLVVLAATNVAGRIVHPPAMSRSFLPADAESQRASALDSAKFTDGHQSVQLVIVDADGLRDSDRALATQLGGWLTSRSRTLDVLTVSRPYPSPDGRALVMQVTFRSTGPAPDGPDPRIAAIEEHLSSLAVPGSVSVAVTGDLAISHDINAGIMDSDSSRRSDLLKLASILIVMVVLALVYRAPLAVLVPLVSIAVVLTVSSPLLDVVAVTLGLPVASGSLPFVFVVVLGAGTNYGLFLLSRFREELRRGADRAAALDAAAHAVAPAIACSAATVALGTAAMGFSSLGFFRTMPAVAISIGVMLAAGLTLAPALIAISGGAFFWPRWPRPTASTGEVASPVWGRVGALVTARPAAVLVAVLILLAPPVLALSRLQVSVDTLGELPGGAPSLAGYHLVQAHFPVQSQAASIFVATDGPRLRQEGDAMGRLRDALGAVPGVTSVSDPTVAADGRAVRFQFGLRDEQSSEGASATLSAAEATARRSLAAGHLDRAEVLAGGEVAVDRDLRELLRQDFIRVVLFVGLAIYLVVAILLRNLFAPLYLLASVGLSTAAAVGGVGLLYREVANQPLFWAVPVFAFVFLVALGEDFNIYLVSRLREQLGESNHRAGIARAVALTGGVISSAGLVMAAAFFLFLGNPVPLVQQLGAVVVIGLLLDTFVVRPFLVPAVVRLAGRRSGIAPARGGREAGDRSAPAA